MEAVVFVAPDVHVEQPRIHRLLMGPAKTAKIGFVEVGQCADGFERLVGWYAVSYTHLDVYKRQFVT